MSEALYNIAGDLQEELQNLQVEDDNLNTIDRICDSGTFGGSFC
ncbi:hypothetical protein IKE_06239 [Bacillus cereus VD196]|uniref:Uncharacterized protein n=1 Tax=Bacillus cereus VD196 TaxID=1053243 RepID=A0A9W5V5N2_BACCE|nr:hypothetical protein [Bacillus cereus]EJR89633.1 hypothetical protein IKG_06031 [Bacillus cereus VD200]EOO58624.1 hypothetical protein IKE_06239 [Bacillus cereus VD196]